MNELVFIIENNLKDYFPIYPELNKNILSIKWIKYLLGLFIFLVVIAIFLSIESPSVKKEYGYVWTAAIAVFVALIIKVVKFINKKKKASTFVNHLVSKGAAQITVDMVGIEMKYLKEIKLIEWRNQGNLHLENNYLMVTDTMGNPITIIPKGTISDERWLEIQETTTSIIKNAIKKMHGLGD